MFRGLVVIIFLCVGCNSNYDDCSDPPVYNLMVRSETSANYDKPLNGFSCSEYADRQKGILIDYDPDPDSCIVSKAQGNPLGLEDAEVGDISIQNTVIKSVKEARGFVYNSRYSFYSKDSIVLINNLEYFDKKQIQLSVKSQNNKLLLYQNKLIVFGRLDGGTVLSVYDFSDVDDIKLVKSFNGLGQLEIKLRNSKLHIYASQKKMNDNIECEEIFYFNKSKNQNLHTKYYIDLSQKEIQLTQGITTYGYLKHHLDENEEFFYRFDGESTMIVKHEELFFYSNSFKGRIPNIFSLKEVDGHLVSFVEESKSNSLLIFDESLKVKSRISNIANMEKIYSARFNEKMAYLVTFREVDPLFSFDLSDLGNPKLLGELKIPGVSRYLHSLQDDYLLGIGNADSSWRDIEISLFNVIDPNLPKKSDSIILRDIPYTSVFYDHHQVTVYKDYIVLKGLGSWNSVNEQFVMVFKHEGDKIVHLGKIKSQNDKQDVIIKDNHLILHEDNDLRIFSLEQGLPQVEWAR